MMKTLKSLFAVSAFLGGALSAASGLAAGVSVGIDTSTPVHLSKEATSVFVGNPAIADVYIQSNKLLFLSGRSFGTTNLIALDAQGKTIMDVPVTVVGAPGETVTLQRGPAGRISYACSGRCEQSPMPGDDPDATKSVMEVTTSKTSTADQVATSGGGAAAVAQ